MARAKLAFNDLWKSRIPSELKPSGAPTMGGYSHSLYAKVLVPEDKLEEAKEILGLKKE